MDVKDAKNLEERKKALKPIPSADSALSLFALWWHNEGFVTSIKQLDSYDDCNFQFTVGAGKKYLLKFCNGVESDDIRLLNGFHNMMEHLNYRCPGLKFPRSVLSSGGHAFEFMDDCPTFGGTRCKVAVRVFTWVDGITLNSAGSTEQLLTQVGYAVGAMSLALQSFDDPGLHRLQFWDGKLL
jgi:Ser/Thr protein kinase RdoA (MazF antagonist)